MWSEREVMPLQRGRNLRTGAGSSGPSGFLAGCPTYYSDSLSPLRRSISGADPVPGRGHTKGGLRRRRS